MNVALTQMGAIGFAFGACASSRSPQPENKKPKIRRFSSTEGKNKQLKKVVPKPATTTMVIDDEEEARDEGASI